MAPSPRKKKVISVTYVPDRTKAVAIGKRITLKKRQTTIRPITFDISVDGDDSPAPVSKDSDYDAMPASQPEISKHDKHTLDEPILLSVVDLQAVFMKDQAEGNQHHYSDHEQENAGRQSSTVDAGHQSMAAEFPSAKAGHQITRHQSSSQKTARHQSQTKKAGHQSETLEAGHQSLSVNVGSQSIGHQFSVPQTVGDLSPPLGQLPTFEAERQSKGTGMETRNVADDHMMPSSLRVMQNLSDKTDAGFKFPAPHAAKNVAQRKDRNAETLRIPNDGNFGDIFRAPLTSAKDLVVSRQTSTVQTPCDTPMRPPNISSIPVETISQSFDVVPANGQPSGLHLCPSTKRQRGKPRQSPPTTDDQPLQDLVIRMKCDSISDENRKHVRPTVSNLSELTVVMSAMEDTIEQFISVSQPNAGIKRFLRDVTEDAFAKLRKVSRASHNIGKLNKQLRASRTSLRRKREELLMLQQEHNRLEVEVAAAAKKEIVADTEVGAKINDYLMKLSSLTSKKIL